MINIDMAWEILSPWLFVLAIITMGLSEVYFMIEPLRGSAWLSRSFVRATQCLQISKDYSNGKFYRPWAQQPILLEPERKKITELSETSILSQRAVYADMFGFEHTIKISNNEEIKVMRSRLYSLILSVRGPDQLTKLYPYLLGRLHRFLDTEIVATRVLADGSFCVPLAGTCRTMASRLMGLIFFGEQLTSDPTFKKALLDHPHQTVICMGLFQLMPSFLAPLVHNIVTYRGKALKLIFSRVIPIIDSETNNWSEPSGLKEATLLDILIKETQPNRSYWTPSALSQAVMGLFLAASHQPWVNLYVFIYRLCESPEWQDILRKEILAQKDQLDYESLSQLPLMDSFMRETVRLVSLDKLSIRRKALRDYTFSDGTPHVSAGTTVCVSSYAVSHDANTYPNPEIFDGRRFVEGRSRDRTHRFADISENYLIWGYGSLACPGRFHATLVLKMMLMVLLLRYDIRLEDKKMRSHWMYESFSMPYKSTRVVLTPRVSEA